MRQRQHRADGHQGGGAPPLAGAADPYEREAEAVANRVTSPLAGRSPAGGISASIRTRMAADAPPPLQRQEDTCTSNRRCAGADECAEPDPEHPGRPESSSSWHLLVNIDVEASSFYQALLSQEVGHTYVVFMESNGRRYSYGFYPADAIPNETRRNVPGCVNHPDTTHARCIDDSVVYSLTSAQYQAALALAQAKCRDRGVYGVDYTCTTFAEDVARAAGQSLPSSRSEPMTVFYQAVPPIDNPNTLLERVQEERRRDPLRRSPVWNDPCVNRCEAEFETCLRTPGPGGWSGMRPMQCMAYRARCLERCASGRRR
jgi:hypothetical protein